MSKIESVVYGAMIVNVGTRLVSGGTKTIWEVTTQDGTKWSTFNTATGSKAKGLEGLYADLKIAIEQKGDFTNYYLNDIQPAKNMPQQAAQAPSPVVQAAQRAEEAAQKGPVVSYDQYKDLEQGKEERKNESIHRQVAAKVSATLSSDMSEFWSNVSVLLNFFRTGFMPGMPQAETSSVTSHTGLPSHTGTDPGDYVSPPPNDWDAPPPTDDDIPF